jgi:hypothetical protein
MKREHENLLMDPNHLSGTRREKQRDAMMRGKMEVKK